MCVFPEASSVLLDQACMDMSAGIGAVLPSAISVILLATQELCFLRSSLFGCQFDLCEKHKDVQWSVP